MPLEVSLLGAEARPEAFLVVSGCVRDYPIDLVGFIRTARLNPLQVGTFLGEDVPGFLGEKGARPVVDRDKNTWKHARIW